MYRQIYQIMSVVKYTIQPMAFMCVFVYFVLAQYASFDFTNNKQPGKFNLDRAKDSCI